MPSTRPLLSLALVFGVVATGLLTPPLTACESQGDFFGDGGDVRGTAKTGEPCAQGNDCVDGVCKEGVCEAPKPNDDVRNGDETDVDCGGGAAPRCGAGKTCAEHGDCESDGCSTEKRCALGRSCTALRGGQSCGEGELEPGATEPGAKHESCCTRLPVPRPEAEGGAYELDKYNVTAGRMRQMVERTGGDVRGWIESHEPSWWKKEWTEWLPSGLDGDRGVLRQLGPQYVDPDQESYNPTFGCNLKNYGARTYWLPDDESRNAGDQPHAFDQDALDPKTQNCATFYMFAAFCAWDGGRLPTIDELDYAWNAGKPDDHLFPWGNEPKPGGFAPENAECKTEYPGATDTSHANYCYGYTFPTGDETPDVTNHIAAPGRFPLGNGPFGHADLAGNVFEVTSTAHTQSADCGSRPCARWSRSGSWERTHPIPYPTAGFPLGRKYWAMGARCARDGAK